MLDRKLFVDIHLTQWYEQYKDISFLNVTVI